METLTQSDCLAAANMESVALIVGGGNSAFTNNYRDAVALGHMDSAKNIGDLCAGYIGFLNKRFANLIDQSRNGAAMPNGDANPAWKVTFSEGFTGEDVTVEVHAADYQQAVNKATDRLNLGLSEPDGAYHFKRCTRSQ